MLRTQTQYTWSRCLRCLAFCCLALSLISDIQAQQASRPNIVVILADDLGYSDLGCYGGEIETPNLDRLSAGGLRFTQFYNTARCWPTRAALLTGYYAQQVRRDKLPDVEGGTRANRPQWAPLLPELLQAAGYRSYHSGKWHIDGPVLRSGFLRSLDMRNQGNYFSVRGNFLDDQPITPSDDQSDYYATVATVEHAIDCLKHHTSQYPNEPFFHYLAFIAPHFPLHARPADIAKYQHRYLSGWDDMRQARIARQHNMGLHDTDLSALEQEIGPPYHFPKALEVLGPGEVNRPVPWDKLTDQQRQFQATKMAIHAAMVDCMDQQIGRLVEHLSETGVLDNTLIMFASDNGASAEIMVRDGGHDPAVAPGSAASYLCLGPGFSCACNTPFRRHKTWVHEGGISTPLIVSWPKGISDRNQLRSTPCHLIDIVPTLLEIAGLKKPEQWKGQAVPPAPGKSLLTAFQQNTTIQRDCLWWLHEGNKAVRVADWKLVASAGEPWELYDLSHDRAEQNNLADTMPNKVVELATLWQQQTNLFARHSRMPETP